MKKTTGKIHRDGQGVWWGLALILACGMAIALAAYQERDTTPKRHIEIGVPISVTPTAQPKPLSLRIDLPALDPEQAYWYKSAQIIARCPLCRGIDQPPVILSDNAITVWLGLLWTESGFHAFAQSEIGCTGLGQLCGTLQTPETDADPMLNLYVSLKEFARLLAANDGNLSTTLENYKGVATSDTQWQASLVWSVVRIGQ